MHTLVSKLCQKCIFLWTNRTNLTLGRHPSPPAKPGTGSLTDSGQ
jgi:hypothetical protein